MTVPEKALAETAEILTGQRGDGRNRALTLSDLDDAGLITLRSSGSGPNVSYAVGGIGDTINNENVTNTGGSGTPVTADTPTQPTGFTATGLYEDVQLQWDNPTYNGHAFTSIFRSSTDDFGTAVKIQESTFRVADDTVATGQTFYYWIRHVNVLGESGPVNATAGTVATTAQDVAQLLIDITGQITSTQLNATLNTRIDDAETNAIAAAASELAASNSAAAAAQDAADAAQDAADAVISENAAAQSALDAAADALAAANDAADAQADAVSTAADVLSTAADAASTAQDLLDTAQDVIDATAQANAAANSAGSASTSAAAAAQDAIDTAADAAATAQDLLDTAQDVIDATAQANAASNSASAASSDAASAAANAALTAQDVIDTASDAIQTASDAIQTAADLAATAQDVIDAAASQSAAGASAVSALNAYQAVTLSNIVPDSSLEEGDFLASSGWDPESGRWTVTTGGTVTPHEGTYMAQVTSSGASDTFAGVFSMPAIDSGEDWTIGLWVFNNTGVSVTFALSNQGGWAGVICPSNNAWTFYTNSGTASAAYTAGAAQLDKRNQGANTSTELYIDQLVIVRGTHDLTVLQSDDTAVTGQAIATDEASAAALSASSATASQSAAGSSASAANISALSASTSAGAASTSESNASTSESNAATSQLLSLMLQLLSLMPRVVRRQRQTKRRWRHLQQVMRVTARLQQAFLRAMPHQANPTPPAAPLQRPHRQV